MGVTTELLYGLLMFNSDQTENTETKNFVPDSTLWIPETNTVALLTGNFIDADQPENGFFVDLRLADGKNWDGWSTQLFPTSFIDQQNIITDENEDWMFYILDGGNSTMSGFRTYTGSELVLSHAPGNYYYGFQVGIDSNHQSELVYGLGGWAISHGSMVIDHLGISKEEYNEDVGFHLTFGCFETPLSTTQFNGIEQGFTLYPNPAQNTLNIDQRTLILFPSPLLMLMVG